MHIIVDSTPVQSQIDMDIGQYSLLFAVFILNKFCMNFFIIL